MSICSRCGAPMTGGICDSCGFPMNRYPFIVAGKSKKCPKKISVAAGRINWVF